MHTDFKDSIKARLYDFKYTPFLASYTFFWIYFNAKLLLIFVDDKLSVQNKIDMMAYSDVNILLPLYLALAYTLIFPIFTAGFYYVTLQYRRLMNKIQQKIEDVTPLPQKEANEIKKENADLRLELDEKIDELNKAKKRFEDKETSLANDYSVKEQELTKGYDTRLENDKKELNSQLHKANIDITDKNTIVSEQKKEIDILKQKLKYFEDKEKNTPKFDITTTDKDLKKQTVGSDLKKVLDEYNKKSESENINITEDEIELLKVIYDNDIPMRSSGDYINKVLEKSTFKRVKVEALITSLTSKGILSLSNGFRDTTTKGREIILSLFDKTQF